MNWITSVLKPKNPNRVRYPQLRLIIILSACFILGSIAVYAAWESYNDYRTIINAAEIQTQGYARALKEHAERTFSEVDLVLQATVRQLEAAGGPDRLGQTVQEQLLRKNAESIPQIGSLVFVDPSGIITATSVEQNDRYPDVSDRPYFRFHQQNSADRPFINPPFKSKVNGKWRFTLSRRINTPSGKFAGIIVAAIEISYFEKLYAALIADRNARYSLATIPGDYLVLAPNAHHVYEAGKQTNAPFQKRVAAASAQTYHVQRSNVFGETRIVSFQRLERYPVVAIMSFNKQYVLSGWRDAAIRTALTNGFLMLLVLFLVLLLLKQIKLLDHKVHKRTAQLSLANRFLENEIGERKQIESNLVNHQQKLEQIAHEVALAEDRERGRIAGELHDQVGQRLILGKIKLDELTSNADSPETQKLLAEVKHLVDQSIQDIRTLTFQMRPPVLASAGLLSALQWLGSELQRDYGLDVRFDTCEYTSCREQLRFEISTNIFQITRELLLNVVKHAGVNTAWLTLQLSSDLLLIRITDNGSGFDIHRNAGKTSAQGGFGLHNIQLKMKNLGGTCLFDTAPGMGTCVTLSLPLKSELMKETCHEPENTDC